jgi:hypothetical protein
MKNMSKKYLYSVGSSLLVGTGFEPKHLRPEIRQKYEDKGIELPENQYDIAFPNQMAKKLGLECINESKSGSGMDYMIRTTFEWIEKNQDKVDQTIFLLEASGGIRLDWYVKKWNEFAIVNAAKNNEGEYPFTLVKDWFLDNPDEQIQWNNEFYEPITQYFNNFYDEDIFRKIEDSKFLFFLSYLNQKGIDYLVSVASIANDFVSQEIEKIIPIQNNLNYYLSNMSIWRYCEHKKWLISDEVDYPDSHIGFFGNQYISDKLVEIVNKAGFTQ